jgi:hypothetical protein
MAGQDMNVLSDWIYLFEWKNKTDPEDKAPRQTSITAKSEAIARNGIVARIALFEWIDDHDDIVLGDLIDVKSTRALTYEGCEGCSA